MLKGNALPYMNIPLAKYKNLFDKTLPRHLKRRRPGAPPPHFIDLGSGFGEALVSATQRGYVATGVELNPTLYLLSIWNVLRHRLWWPFDARVRLVCGDMWKQDLRFEEQDVILMFGVQSLMARLTAKVQAEAKHDALVVLYRFQLTLPASLSSSSVAGEGLGAEGRGGTKTNSSNAEIELLEVSEEEFSVYRVHRPIIATGAGGEGGEPRPRIEQVQATAAGDEILQK
jgi:SAM-dependent methyltransferase